MLIKKKRTETNKRQQMNDIKSVSIYSIFEIEQSKSETCFEMIDLQFQSVT